jgi:antitoxin component HigA of HigAB toxin-antitoxin module
MHGLLKSSAIKSASGRYAMAAELKPIRSNADYEAALAEVERLWGAKAGTPKGDRLDVLAYADRCV